MAEHEDRPITGYWLADGARFGEYGFAPGERIGSRPDTTPIHRATAACGITVTVTHHALVLADFSDWPRDREPIPTKLRERVAFAESSDLAESIYRLGRRVTVLNAHQTCLLGRLWHDDPDEPYSPDPRPVTAESAWRVSADGQASIPDTDRSEYMSTLEDDESDDAWAMWAPTYPVEFVQQAFDDFVAVIDAGDVAVKSAELLLYAAWHYEAHRFGQALLCAYPAAEALLRELWKRHVAESLASESGPVASTLSDSLGNPRRLARVILDVMVLAGKVDNDTFMAAIRATTARNALAHQLGEVAADDVSDAIYVTNAFLRDFTGAGISLPHGITGHGI